MGNCPLKRKKKSARSDVEDTLPPSLLRLHSSPSSPWTYWIRIALSYKPISVEFFPTEESTGAMIELGSEARSGPHEELLRYIDYRYPDPPLLDPPETAGRWPALEMAVVLQHRSMSHHLDRVVKWAEEMASRPERRSSDPSLGSLKMEFRKFGLLYAQLLELLVEHAQVEERVIFPVLEKAERGLCSDVQEDHARDLPIMNGIKEDIKSIGVLDTESDSYLEAMINICARLHSLQENCEEHFEEEERELLPLLEAAGVGKGQQEHMLGQCLKETMQSTHSNLFRLFMSGLLPKDTVQYLYLVAKCCDPKWASSLLESLTTDTGTVRYVGGSYNGHELV